MVDQCDLEMRERQKEWDRKTNGFIAAGGHWRRIDVSRRARQSEGGSEDHLKVLEGVSKSFFFTGFSEDWEHSAMWRFFRTFGNVVDVFVPQKRTKNGQRFGFIRYKGVKDEGKLVALIIETWAGNENFIFSKARFERLRNSLSQPPNVCLDVKEYNVVPGWKTTEAPHTIGRSSYAEMASHGNLVQIHAGKIREAELSWLSCCLLAEVKSPDLLNDLSSLFEGAGFLNMAVKYVGGLRVLLECKSEESARKCLNEGLSTLLSWFNWVCPWTVEKEAERPGRLIWLSISGVPLHSWNGDTFTAIASSFGKVLEVEDWTEERV